ncbi:MAG TPA: adenosylmethionine decarboxylase [Candidatus Norongarragalinales archaeon]|nr:adenosylmethionine decarboxylase [Candidatus Norongarragalinales archaeon]
MGLANTGGLGKHLIVEFFGCPYTALDDEKGILSNITSASRAAGLTVITARTHKFSPHGVTGFVLLSESHLSIHTWPEFGYAAVDIFTCGNADPHKAIPMLNEFLKPTRHDVRELSRGKLPAMQSAMVLKPKQKIG